MWRAVEWSRRPALALLVRSPRARWSGYLRPARRCRHAAATDVEAVVRDLEEHGHRLAYVNVLRGDGLMLPPDTIARTLPPTLAPLLELRVHLGGSEATRLPDAAADGLASALPRGGALSDQRVAEAVRAYCGPIGFDCAHVATEAERHFFRQCAAEHDATLPSVDSRVVGIAECALGDEWVRGQLAMCAAFEGWMQKRYPHAKRFSLAGLHGAIPLLNALIGMHGAAAHDHAACGDHALPRVVLGTTHRGRLDMHAHVLRQPIAALARRWDATGGPTYDDICTGHSADVCVSSLSRPVHVSMPPIPAHLEALVPAMLGKARAHVTALAGDSETMQHSSCELSDSDAFTWACSHILPMIVHGDASFCGQGVVAESLLLGTLRGYSVGGAVHVILNNQIGYTTEMAAERSLESRAVLSSDVAKASSCPVLHVNSAAPQALVRAAHIAIAYRRAFRRDLVLNVWGFRSHGHNEMDEPRITNVRMYQGIDARPRDWIALDAAIEGADFISVEEGGPEDLVNTEVPSTITQRPTDTRVSSDELRDALRALVDIPGNFALHKIVKRHVDRRRKLLDGLPQLDGLDGSGATGGALVDWATAELLALNTMAQSGLRCRLVGQDVARGTFTQRHAVAYDSESGAAHRLVHQRVEVINAPVTELAAVGFELGWSSVPRPSLCVWEAQFGDFANNAQPIIDTAIVSQCEKWGYDSNLVLLLPHGYDGMGPEHSSARPERWLQMHPDTPEHALKRYRTSRANSEEIRSSACASTAASVSPFSVLHLTDPANLFHALRSQVLTNHVRPLIVLSPKRMLHHRRAVSALSDFLVTDERVPGGCAFQPVLDDVREDTNRDIVTTLWLCSGESYYDLLALRESGEIDAPDTVAIVRLEQLAPFPELALANVISRYPGATRALWCQEEPYNGGARAFVTPFFDALAREALLPALAHISVVSRASAASPATGHPRVYAQRQEKLRMDIIRRTNEK